MTYRVWNAINRPAGVDLVDWHRRFIPVHSPLTGSEVIEVLRAQQAADPFVGTSEFGLEYLSVGGWKEWYDSGGLDVLERFGSELCHRELVPV